MKVRIDDTELARVIGIGLAVTGKRGQSKDHAVSIMRQLAPYSVFREAGSAESEAQRREQRRHFDWPLRLIVK